MGQSGRPTCMVLRLAAIAFLLASCVLPSVEYDTYFTIGVSESVRSPVGKLTFVEVVRDNRCPPWADCVSDETVSIRVEITAGGVIEGVVLDGVLIPLGGDHPRFPALDLADGSRLTLVDMTFGREEPEATLFLNAAPRM